MDKHCCHAFACLGEHVMGCPNRSKAEVDWQSVGPELVKMLGQAEANLGENLWWITDKLDVHIRVGDKEAAQRLKQIDEAWRLVVKAMTLAKKAGA